MKIVSVCACTAGIAHTYMAQEVIEQECKRRNHQIKVETQGGMGTNNELSQQEIDEADAVILAVSIGIEMEERFDDAKRTMKVIEIDPSAAIKNIRGLLDRVEEL